MNLLLLLSDHDFFVSRLDRKCAFWLPLSNTSLLGVLFFHQSCAEAATCCFPLRAGLIKYKTGIRYPPCCLWVMCLPSGKPEHKENMRWDKGDRPEKLCVSDHPSVEPYHFWFMSTIKCVFAPITRIDAGHKNKLMDSGWQNYTLSAEIERLISNNCKFKPSPFILPTWYEV